MDDDMASVPASKEIRVWALPFRQTAEGRLYSLEMFASVFAVVRFR